MQDTSKKINYARLKLGITQDFQCYNSPQTEEEYNRDVKWIVGEDKDGNAVYGDTQLITWEQVQEFAEEASTKWALNKLREERDRRLAETDWWAVADRTMTPEQTAYRQALRDITDTSQPELDWNDQLDLTSVDWPVKP
jgi:hypothetical protein